MLVSVYELVASLKCGWSIHGHVAPFRDFDINHFYKHWPRHGEMANSPQRLVRRQRGITLFATSSLNFYFQRLDTFSYTRSV